MENPKPSGAGAESVDVELRTYSPGDETRIVQILSASHRQGWDDVAVWRWKHLRRPGFVPEDVVTAFVDDEMVGCFHGAVLPIRLDPGLEVPMSFDGDFAVLADQRGKGIPNAAHDLTDRDFIRRGIVLRGGFTSRELNERFYHKRYGYVFVRSVDKRFRKFLDVRSLKPKVEALGNRLLANARIRRALAAQPMFIDLNIDRFPPCHLELTDKSFALLEGRASDSQLELRAPYEFLIALSRGRGRLVRAILFDVLRGRLRARGLFRLLPRVVRRLLP